MKTLTVTKARAKLGHWVKRAAAGEEIGIIIGAKLVALRPVAIQAGDYAEQEYGLSAAEMDAAAVRISAESRAMIDRGDFVSLQKALDVLARPRRKKSPRASRRAS